MTKKIIFGALLLFLFIIGSLFWLVPSSNNENDPKWVKAFRFPEDQLTVYYDAKSLLVDKDVTGVILLYVSDDPYEIKNLNGATELVKSKMATIVLDCTENRLGIATISFYRTEKPTLDDKPVNAKEFDPMPIREIPEDSPLKQLFC